MKKEQSGRMDVAYKKEIEWLRWYYLQSRKNAKHTILGQMIADREKELETTRKVNNQETTKTGGRKTSEVERVIIAKEEDGELNRLKAIKETLDQITKTTDDRLLKSIKAAYVYQEMNLTACAYRIMFVSERTAYYKVKEWLKMFSDSFLEKNRR